MDDLVTWLRAQLDDDVRALDEYEQFHAGLPVTTIAIPPGCLLGEPFDPGRQRREVDAKRRILDLHAPYPTPQHMASGDITACSTCGSVDDSPVAWPCPTVRLLALPYAGRPGYRDEWKP